MWSNLLKHATGVPDGWDSEEDLPQQEEDEHDEPEDMNDPTTYRYDQEHEHEGSDSPHEHEEPYPERPPSLLASAMLTPGVGGGSRFMGRLSAFIEQVTQADEDDDDEEEEEEEEDDDDKETMIPMDHSSPPYHDPRQPDAHDGSPPHAPRTPQHFFTPLPRPNESAEYDWADALHEHASHGWDDEEELQDWGEEDSPGAAMEEDEEEDAAVLAAVNLAQPFVPEAPRPETGAQDQQEDNNNNDDNNAWEQDDPLDAVSLGSDPPFDDANQAVQAAVDMAAANTTQHDMDLNASTLDMLATAAASAVRQDSPDQWAVDQAWDNDNDLDLSAVSLPHISTQPHGWEADEELHLDASDTHDEKTHYEEESTLPDSIPLEALPETNEDGLGRSEESQRNVDLYGEALPEMQEDMRRLSYDEEEEICFDLEEEQEEEKPPAPSQQAEAARGPSQDLAPSEPDPSQTGSSTLAELEAEMQNLSLGKDSPPSHVDLMHASDPPTDVMAVVDHTPSEHGANGLSDPQSTTTLPDVSSRSSSVNTPQNPFDTENEIEFGPIVDHTPKRTALVMDRQVSGESMCVAVGGVSTEDTLHPGWEEDDELLGAIDGAEDNGNDPYMDMPHAPPDSSFEDHVVDHTPGEIGDDGSEQRANTDMSVGVLVPDDTSTRAGEDDRVEDYGPVVDHTPLQSNTVHALADPSILTNLGSSAVYAPTLEDDYGLDETECGEGSAAANGWDDDNDDNLPISHSCDEEEGVTNSAVSSASSGPAPMTTSSVKFRIEGLEEVHIVDHTPRDMEDPCEKQPNDPSLVALATEHDLSRDTGNGDDEDVYDDENDFEYGPIVDQTPPTPSGTITSSALSTTNSMAVVGEASEYNDDDALDETAYGDSTEGGGTLDDGMEGWEQVDIDPGAECQQDFVVDHTPSEMNSPSLKGANASVIVLADATSMKEDDSVADPDSSEVLGVGFGPVVDHTPETPLESGVVFPEDSVAVQAPDLDTIDETCGFDNNKDEDDGGDTIDEDEANNLRSPQNMLVDHIPLGTENYGDASTMVAADPSEVMSEVDDMVGTEDNFGPVVDQIPPTRPDNDANLPSMAESATGSTVAFAPASLAADDLDADDNGTRLEDVEEFPNPQSGGDDDEEPDHDILDDEQDNEQVVDVLPPDDGDDAGVPDHEENREALSVLTVGGAQSLLLPLTLDVKEDEFGPVVDQLPLSRSSLSRSGVSSASSATQLTSSEYRAMIREDLASTKSDDASLPGKAKVVIDYLPRRFRPKHPPGSTSSIGGSQLPEDDDDDEEDNSKFGPIVDQLPTSCAPSCGGSTVDALANVSEGGSDDDEADAWEDDVDVDISESGVSDGTALRTAAATRLACRKNDVSERNVTVRFETMIRSSESALEEVQYYDMSDEQGIMTATENALPSEHIASSSLTLGEVADVEVESVSETRLERGTPFPKSFAEADTPPSTPYRRYDGIEDRSRLNLQTCSSCESGTTTECPCLQRLLRTDGATLVGKILTPEGEELEINFSEMLEQEIIKRNLVEQEAAIMRNTLKSMEFNESLHAAKQLELESENARLLKLHMSPEDESIENRDGREADLIGRLQNELQLKNSSFDELLAEVAKLRKKHPGNENDPNVNELKFRNSDSETIEQLTSKIEELYKSNEDLSKEVSAIQTAHEMKVQELNELLDKKALDIKQMEDLAKLLTEEKSEMLAKLLEQESLSEQAQAVASTLLTAKQENDVLEQSLLESDRTIRSLQKLIDESNAKNEKYSANQSSKIASLEAEVTRLTSLIEHKDTEAEAERAFLSEELEKLRQLLEELSSKNHAMQESLQHANEKYTSAESDKLKLAASIQSLENELAKSNAERMSAETERQISMSHLAALGRTLEAKEKQAFDQINRISQLEVRVQEQHDELSTIRTAHKSLVSERDGLMIHIKEIESRFANSRTEGDEKLTALVVAHGSEITEKEVQLEVLAKELDQLKELAEHEKNENVQLMIRCRKAEDLLTKSASDAQVRYEQLLKEFERARNDLDEERHALSHQLAEQSTNYANVVDERNKLLSQCTKLQEQISLLQESLQRVEDDLLAREAREQELLDTSCEHRALVDKLTADNTELRQQLASLQSADEETVLYEQRIAELEGERLQWMEKSREYSLCQEELAKARSEVSCLTEENEDMLIQYALLKQQMDAAEVRLAALGQERASLDDKTQPGGSVFATLQENMKLQQELLEASESKEALQAILNENTKEKDRLAGENDRLETSLKELQAQLKSISLSRDEEMARLNEEENLSASVQRELEMLKKENEYLKLELTKIEVQLHGTHDVAKEIEYMKSLLNERDEAIIRLRSELETAKDSFSMTRDQLEIAQATLAVDEKVESCALAIDNLENIEAQSGASSLIAEYEKRMNEIQQELTTKADELNEKNELVHKLQESLSQLQDQLSMQGSHTLGQSISLSHLQHSLHLATVSEEPTASSSHELEELKKELDSVKQQLACKEDELSSGATSVPVPKVDQNGDDDIHNLRSHIVSLAVALERSENRRAESIAKLMAEREASAESLRRLSESVKRFYASVTYGDV